ncbi:MAG: N-acetylmuramoyl-L-alanine amidase [Sphingomonas sp.]|nr:N-acetylmuramoyl-L-alanine amidase [Sphingomonas sp.]
MSLTLAGVERGRSIGLAIGVATLVAIGVATSVDWGARTGVIRDAAALIGEARTGRLTLDLPEPVADVRVREARLPGRPIVLIDPGHGGRDPGAPGVSGSTSEKELTLAMARELADLLEERGRVRVALTREDDRYLTLEQRAAIARRLQASLFLSLHMDSAPNPLARGATIYSLSDVASSAAAARFAEAENQEAGALSSEADDSVRALLADVALREQMEASAGLAERLLRRAAGRVELRPRPHQFASRRCWSRQAISAMPMTRRSSCRPRGGHLWSLPLHRPSKLILPLVPGSKRAPFTVRPMGLHPART